MIKPSPRIAIATVAYIAVLIIGISLLWRALLQPAYSNVKQQSWPSAPASLTAITISNAADNTHCLVRVTYEYQLGGRQYVSQPGVLSDTGQVAGQNAKACLQRKQALIQRHLDHTFTVFVNPTQPTESLLSTQLDATLITTASLSLAGLILVCTAGFIQLIKRLATPAPAINVAVAGTDTKAYELAEALQNLGITVVLFINDQPWNHKTTLLDIELRYPSELPSLVVKHQLTAIVGATEEATIAFQTEALAELCPFVTIAPPPRTLNDALTHLTPNTQ